MKLRILFILSILVNLDSFGWDIVPKPTLEKMLTGNCLINPSWKWACKPDSLDAVLAMYQPISQWADSAMPGYFKPFTPFDYSTGTVFLETIKRPELGKEGYQMEIKKDEIRIKAQTVWGLFYGLQTLKQLILPLVSDQKDKTLKQGFIQDVPRFEWRGMHLDVSRHFFTVREVEMYIDMLAAHKMNVFHWHLTDDQGWRLEILHSTRAELPKK